MIPSIVQIGFGILVVFMLFSYLFIFQKVSFYVKRFRHFLLVWLAATAILAMNHFFEDFKTLPPRIPLFVFFYALALSYFIFRLFQDKAFARIQQKHLVIFQCFRIGVEVLLSMLAEVSLLPKEMSFHGQNFDIITGITAIAMFFVIQKQGEQKSRKLLIAWNIMGLLLVSSVMIFGMLSAPYPFQIIKSEPANFIVGYFPVIWLPTFLAPTAYFFHIVSLLKTRYSE